MEGEPGVEYILSPANAGVLLGLGKVRIQSLVFAKCFEVPGQKMLWKRKVFMFNCYSARFTVGKTD